MSLYAYHPHRSSLYFLFSIYVLPLTSSVVFSSSQQLESHVACVLYGSSPVSLPASFHTLLSLPPLFVSLPVWLLTSYSGHRSLVDPFTYGRGILDSCSFFYFSRS